MKESERLRAEAEALEPAEVAYADVMASVRSAALLLESAEETMAKLISSHEWATGTGAIFEPSLFQRLAGNKNVDAQVRLAKAVCAFVREWKALRDAAIKGEL